VSLVRGNIVPVHDSANPKSKSLRLITFDGVGTKYDDDDNFSCPILTSQIVNILTRGIIIGLVTAAAYGYEYHKYVERINYLIDTIKYSKFGCENMWEGPHIWWRVQLFDEIK